MSRFLFVVATLVALAVSFTSCQDVNKELLGMVPDDATALIVVDLQEVLTDAGIITDGEVKLTQRLSSIIDDNDGSIMGMLLTDLPVSGVDHDNNAVIYFGRKTFGRVCLVHLSDAKATKDVVERRMGADFSSIEGVDCLTRDDNVVAIINNTLLMAKVNRDVDINKAARVARSIVNGSYNSLITNPEVEQALDTDGSLKMWFKGDDLARLLRESSLRDAMEQMPLLPMLLDSDIKAVVASMKLEGKQANITLNIISDEGSEFRRLLRGTLNDPSNSFLKAIPNSMRYIISLSVKGDSFVELPQVKTAIGALKAMPYIGHLDFEGIMRSIDGPLAVGLAPDPTFDDQWNAVIVARTTMPQVIVNHVSEFATQMGQAPQVIRGEYVYEYNNKAIAMGVKDDVLYIKMLDYEQTEGYASEMQDVSEFFSKSSFGIYAIADVRGDNLTLNFGLESETGGSGTIVTSSTERNVAATILEWLCTIKPTRDFDDNFNEF